MSMIRFPVPSAMPGLTPVQVILDQTIPVAGTGNIIDKTGGHWSLKYDLDHKNLAITIDQDGSVCSFVPWIGYPEFWSASGLFVNTQGVGLASAFYMCARQLIGFSGGKQISPSDNVTPLGHGLWNRLDPSIAWEPVAATGGFRLDLSSRAPP
jgi:hypothetical protein